MPAITMDSPELMRFVVLAQALVDAYRETMPTIPGEELYMEKGSRYIKVWAKPRPKEGWNLGPGKNRGRIYAFIDTTNGDILKPASCKAPAKHARGNVHDENPVARCTHYGPEYLK